MKNKKIYFGALVLLMMGISACDENFLESLPTDYVTTESFYQNDDDFIKAINGVYNALAEYRQNQDYFPMLECATPCATQGNFTSGRWKAYAWGGNGYTATECQFAEGWWVYWWRGVRRASDVIDQVNDKGDVISSAALKDRILGEAYFLRAYNYFFLAYLYGDVPYITTAADSIYPYRSTQADIVALMISDLQQAEELLPSVTTYRNTDDIGRASKGSAVALLGKIYCFEKRWAAAEVELKKLEASGDYGLNSSFVDQFVETSAENGNESIFELQYLSDNGDDRVSAYATFCGIGAADMGGSSNFDDAGFNYNQPTEYLTDMYETRNGYAVQSTWVSNDGTKDIYSFTSDDPAFDTAHPFDNRDPRLMWTVMFEGSPYLNEKFPENSFTADDPTQQNYGTVKYIVLQESRLNSGQNHIAIRYADMLLLLAEALMEQNKSGEAATYVNQVRGRSSVDMPDVPDAVVADQAKMREFIHKERIRELAMEFGHVFFDLRRWGIYASEMNAYWTPNKHGNTNAVQANFTTTQNLWPIPQSERDLNKNLTQNEGY